MIRWLVSKNGYKVPVVDGAALCSMVDPIKESEKWYDSNKDLLEVENVFVMGLAGGFHVEMLLKNNPSIRITVIENHSQLVSGMMDRISEWGDRVTVLTKPDINQVKAYESFHSIFEEGSYCVLRHPASYLANKQYYQEIEAFILGRSKEGIQYLSKIKSKDKYEYERMVVDNKLDGSENIKDVINKINSAGKNLSDDDLIWLALGEIIH